MEIDPTDAQDFTIDRVSALLASAEDDADRQLRVTNLGKAFLSEVTGAENIQGLKFRLETWDAGNAYVGSKAAADSEWVERIFYCIKLNWPNPKATVAEILPLDYYR